MATPREPLLWAAAGLLAVVVPACAARHLDARVRALGPRLSALTGEPSSIGAIEAGPTGEVRLRALAIGDVVRVEAMEASIGFASLLAGDLGIDEIRLERPRLGVRASLSGDSNLARIARRVAERRPRGDGRGAARRPLRRVIVTEGDLVLDVAGVGRVEARQVELHPQRDGVRVVTGRLRLAWNGELAGRAPVRLEATFERAGGDLSLPEARLQRFLAVSGALEARVGGADAEPLRVVDATAGWGAAAATGEGRTATLRGSVLADGAARAVAVSLRPGPTLAVDVRGERLPLGALAAVAPTGLSLADARGSGALTVVRTAVGWSLRVAGELDGLVVDHPALAEAAVPVSGRLEAIVDGADDVVTVAAARLEHGALRLDGRGRLRFADAGVTSGELALSLAETPCADALASVPTPLRGPLHDLVIDGTVGGDLALAFDLAAPAGEGLTLGVAARPRCRVLFDPPDADPRALAGVAEHTFPDGVRAPVGPGLGDWAPLPSLPAYVDGAFVSAEDARFFGHDGFDLTQIARSLEIDLRQRRFARGGSTISQQLVKNAFLHHRRSLGRKLQEAVLTWRLEDVLDKRQILERYLNIVELGPGVHGVAAAARHWFGRPPAQLTVAQAAFLAALTPEPRTMTRRVRAAGGLDPASAERVATVLRHMARARVITPAEHAVARRADLQFRRAALVGDELARR